MKRKERTNEVDENPERSWIAVVQLEKTSKVFGKVY